MGAFHHADLSDRLPADQGWYPGRARYYRNRERFRALGLTAEDALAMGDGANDLDMIKAAGLGIAFHAKPIVAAQTTARIAYTDLRTALLFQGYAVAEFASA